MTIDWGVVYKQKRKRPGYVIDNSGLEFLAAAGIEFRLHERVKIYYDPETGRIGLKRSPEALHQFVKPSKKSSALGIASADLRRTLEKKTDYKVERSQEFDVLLIPVPAPVEIQP